MSSPPLLSSSLCFPIRTQKLVLLHDQLLHDQVYHHSNVNKFCPINDRLDKLQKGYDRKIKK